MWTNLKHWGKASLLPATEQRQVFFWVTKGLGSVFLIAFLSLMSQWKGLYSSDGILPIAKQLAYLNSQDIGWWQLPHALVGTSDSVLAATLWIGVLASCAWIAGLVPVFSAGVAWLMYVSFVNLGSVFMSFQWDVLLLEIGFLWLWGMPWVWVWRPKSSYAPPRWVMWASYACCFRLMLASGLVKLRSGDPVWRNFTALEWHYWTQPVPHKLSWWVHQLPNWFHQISVGLMFMVELILPFGIWAGRRLRAWAGCVFMGFMGVLMLTGNFCFFNLLTILLALALCDDAFLNRSKNSTTKVHHVPNRPWRLIGTSVACITLVLGLAQDTQRFWPQLPLISTISTLAQPLRPFHVTNTYGLFATMTKTRNEIGLWASQDGNSWKPYIFKYKPNNAQDPPRWTFFHQPRLDWQLWFTALRGYSKSSWINNLVMPLFNQNKNVEALFESVPFPEQGPRYLVFVSTPFRFTSMAQKKENGAWWKLGEVGQFSPVFDYE